MLKKIAVVGFLIITSHTIHAKTRYVYIQNLTREPAHVKIQKLATTASS